MAPSTAMCLSRLPAEIKIHILKYLDGRDLHSMVRADISYLHLWQQYPRQIFRAVWNNIFYKLHPEVQYNAYIAFRLREVKREHIETMGNRREDDQDRDVLRETMRSILLYGDDKESSSDNYSHKVEMVVDIESLAAYSDMVSEVDSLVDRYANDAWQRIRGISLETGTSNPSPAGTIHSVTNISLTTEERGLFQRAFVAAEIYLLATFYTNGQGNRYSFKMGRAIHEYVPIITDDSTLQERRRFDSCLRYIFHAYRTHLRRTARELGVPEFPTGHEQLHTGWAEEEGGPLCKKQCVSASSASPAYHSGDEKGAVFSKLDDKIRKFAQRSTQDEQRFLLWLCQFGISSLEQIHRASAAVRRAEILRQFSRTQLWDTTVILRHLQYRNPFTRTIIRQRHPVKNLYGFCSRIEYGICGTPWACASAFLDWEWMVPDRMSGLRRRGDVVLNERGRWITLSDTDSGPGDWNPFESRHNVVPSEHIYVLDREQYSFRSLPRRIFLLTP